MTNKLKKHAKFVLSISLILGLAGASYAKISTSDGSSFVTKSEFDSAFADFNSRLTTFESSINSKIDSQVTAYLDANGIWSKTPITFKDGSTSYEIVSGLQDHITDYGTDGTYLLAETDWDWAQMKKAGLSSWNINQTETGYRELHKQSNVAAVLNTYTWYLTFEVYDKDGNLSRIAYNIVLRSGNPTYEWSSAKKDWMQIFVGYSPSTYPVYFFVNEGEYVKFSETWDNAGSYDWTGSWNKDYIKGNLPKYVFSDCGIY